MLYKGSIPYGRRKNVLAVSGMLMASAGLIGQSFFVLPEASAATLKDRTDPTVTITSPSDGATNVSQTSHIKIRGAASDNIGGSGINVVEVKVDSGAYVTATPKARGDWSSWTVTMDVKSSGNHRITSRVTDNAGNQAWSSVYVNVSSGPTLDKFGIEQIYPTATGGNEWYVNMNNPTSDPMFRNLPPMTKQSDGSWQVSSNQVRMEVLSPPPSASPSSNAEEGEKKWLNVEMTAYAKIIDGSPDLS